MAVYNLAGNPLATVYDKDGNLLSTAYDKDGNLIYTIDSDIPVPSGDLTASQVIPLPDLYEEGKGFTCTGLGFDGAYYYIGDIGILDSSDTSNISSQIVVTSDFVTVDHTIDIKAIYPNSGGIQGVCIDSSDDTIWACDPNQQMLYHITKAGAAIESISATTPTGIAYSASDDTLWVLNYSNKIVHMSTDGTVLVSYNFAYNEALDQCFLDEDRGLLYITAGTNYSGRNNVYCFNVSTHEQYIACTVDSYSVEGIWLGDDDKMIILNDGYYHSATVAVNQANIYTIS